MTDACPYAGIDDGLIVPFVLLVVCLFVFSGWNVVKTAYTSMQQA